MFLQDMRQVIHRAAVYAGESLETNCPQQTIQGTPGDKRRTAHPGEQGQPKPEQSSELPLNSIYTQGCGWRHQVRFIRVVKTN